MGEQGSVLKSRAVLVFLAVLVGAVGVSPGQPGQMPGPRFLYVDAVGGNDHNEGLLPSAAFATIQKAVETAEDGDTVLVYPGVYRGEVNFRGKAITLQGIASGPGGIAVLHNPGDFAVSLYSGEGPDSVLKNFVVRGSFMAVFIADSSPTISNLTIVENTYGIEAFAESKPQVTNCIFWKNTGGDLFGCQARFSNTTEAGPGNIAEDPLFVDPNSGDYHLLSERGRYWIEHDVWVLDWVTSPCIDGGDPSVDPTGERVPNGNRINMGAYGGTSQASLSPDTLVGKASNPSPTNGAVQENRNVILSWTPGLNAVLHEVYLWSGVEFPPPLVSSQSETQYDAGRLDRYTNYFWRVDEIDSEGNRVVGDIWTFTITGPPPKGRACFVSGTGVWVNGALVSISEVARGSSVGPIKRDGMEIPSPCRGTVEQVQEHEGIFECYDVLLESGNRITVAEQHYFLTESGEWLGLRDLKAGARLRTAARSVTVTKITRRPMPYMGKVYNLKIRNSDRYLVGKDGLVVRDY